MTKNPKASKGKKTETVDLAAGLQKLNEDLNVAPALTAPKPDPADISDRAALVSKRAYLEQMGMLDSDETDATGGAALPATPLYMATDTATGNTLGVSLHSFAAAVLDANRGLAREVPINWAFDAAEGANYMGVTLKLGALV